MTLWYITVYYGEYYTMEYYAEMRVNVLQYMDEPHKVE